MAQGREGDQGVGKRVYTRAQINLEVMGLVTVFIVVMVSHSKRVCTHQIVHVNYVQFTVCRKVAKENRGRKMDGPRKQPHPSALLGAKFKVDTLYRRPFQSNLHNAEIPPREGKI